MTDLDDEAGFLGSLVKNEVADSIQEPTFGMSVTFTPIIEDQPLSTPYEKPPLTKRLCCVDLETDPFRHGRVPQPFWAGFYDGEDFFDFWGDNCIHQFFEHISVYTEELCIYAHNGGKFDFHYMMEYLDGGTKPFIINGRLVKIMLQGQEFRDSFSILPVALKRFQKLEIEYWKFERDVRDEYMEEIRRYARFDVISLYETVSDFIARFGWRITIASTALSLLESFHGYNRMTPDQDTRVRPFYRGGRVQCIETGLLFPSPGHRFLMIDRNSMYPTVMRDYLHPVGALTRKYTELRDDTAFACIEAYSRGALGTFTGGDLNFKHRRAKYLTTMHEIRAGLETSTLDIVRVIWSLSFQHYARFDAFVNNYYSLRMQADASGDKSGKEFYKLILNSAYGRLAMNTSGYKDWLVNPDYVPKPIHGERLLFEQVGEKQVCIEAPDGWKLSNQDPGLTIFSKPRRDAGKTFLNVAAAASITGAARADLWRAICKCERPLYCDTDSIICESSPETMGSALGEWKIEAIGDAVLIAGKKMYAFLSLEPHGDSEEVCIDDVTYYVLKKAHKGVQLRGEQILDICRGGKIVCNTESPAFNFGGETKFTSRVVSATGVTDIDGDLFVGVN